MTISRTIQLLEPYVERASAPLHFSRLFTVPRNGIHNQATVRVPVRRGNRAIATPMNHESTGYHQNERTGWSRKDLTPAVYKEAFGIKADDLMGQEAFGQNPFENANLMARAEEEIGLVMADLQDMIRRGMELQASQIMQSGTLTLVNAAGNTVFSEDFAVKSTHFPNASTTWATTGSAVPLVDIKNLCDLIVQDGMAMPQRVHMNAVTFAQMQATDSFLASMNRDYRTYNGEIYRLNSGVASAYAMPGSQSPGGGLFRGQLEVANYLLDLYVYEGGYDHPNTGTYTKYLADYKCVVESGARMDATFGALNTFGTDGRANRFLTRGRVANRDNLMDLNIAAWITPDGDVFNVGLGTRALLYPVATDTFGCITTAGF